MLLLNLCESVENTDLQINHQCDPEAKNTIEYKEHKEHNALDVPSPLNYTVAELNVFRKKRTTHFYL